MCVQQECFDQNFYILLEPADKLTKFTALDSTSSTPETPERCALSHRIEPSLSPSLGPVALPFS